MNKSKFFETLDLKIDINRLATETKRMETSFAAVDNTVNYQSWSLLTRDGRYQSGFENYFSYKNGPLDIYQSRLDCPNRSEVYFAQDENKPTEICTGYFREILMGLDALGFWPRRARINLMKPNRATSVHVDVTNEKYAAILHIPIITNPDCLFNFVEERVHMPADGQAYIVDQTKKHQFINGSGQNRYHLLVCVWDTRQVTKQFGFPAPNIPLLSGIDWNAGLNKAIG